MVSLPRSHGPPLSPGQRPPELKRKDPCGITQMGPRASPAKRAAGGKEPQRNERAVTLKKVGASDMQLARSGSPQSRPLALWGKEEQRNERALTFEKSRSKRYAACSDVVEEDGFEPSKAKPADLQSVPFGHLGTPPYSVGRKKGGAGGRIRTPDLLITNQLLYRLSYTSTEAFRIHSGAYYNSTSRACQLFFKKNSKR